MSKNIISGFCLLLVFAFGFQLTTAQQSSPISPPLGPANFRSETFGISVGDLTNDVRDKVNQIVADTNSSLAQSGESARLEFRSIKVYKPAKLATVYPDQPNQWFIQILMRVHIEIVMPWHSSNRQLYIPINIHTSCKGWFSTTGTIQVDAYPQPISIEGGNIIEEILRIKNYVDNRIRNSIPQMTFTSVSTPFRCSTLGFVERNADNHQQDSINFDLPATASPFPFPTVEQTAEVTFIKLKRLKARNLTNAILYEPLENITLETYTNHSYRQAAGLLMSENDQVALNMQPVNIKKSAFDKMIVIATIKQRTPGSGIPDSNFEVNYRNADFTPGFHTIKISKLYSRRVNNATIHTRVDAYELTYFVRTSMLANS